MEGSYYNGHVMEGVTEQWPFKWRGFLNDGHLMEGILATVSTYNIILISILILILMIIMS